MARIFGLDVGTTSIGFAVIDHEPEAERGSILRLGARVFPEARDSDGTPLNQTRRHKRMVRRQLRRRRIRRRLLNETLATAGLLPAFGSPAWPEVMALDPYSLRKRGIAEPLSAFEMGRALYHLAHRRHFRGRELADAVEDQVEDVDEKVAATNRESALQALKATNKTLGAWLAERNPHKERLRGIHAHRSVVEQEFNTLWTAQSAHHAALGDAASRPKSRTRFLLSDRCSGARIPSVSAGLCLASRFARKVHGSRSSGACWKN